MPGFSKSQDILRLQAAFDPSVMVPPPWSIGCGVLSLVVLLPLAYIQVRGVAGMMHRHDMAGVAIALAAGLAYICYELWMKRRPRPVIEAELSQAASKMIVTFDDSGVHVPSGQLMVPLRSIEGYLPGCAVARAVSDQALDAVSHHAARPTKPQNVTVGRAGDRP